MNAAEIAEHYAGTIRAQERAAADLGPFGPALVAASIEQTLSGGVKPLPPLPPKPEPRMERELVFIAQDAAVRRIWQLHRIVYDIHETLWDELGETDPSTVIPGGLMSRLPHPNPFIAIPRPIVMPLPDKKQMRMQGFFVIGRATALNDDDSYIQVSTDAPSANGNIGLLMGAGVETLDGRPSVLRHGVQDMVFNRVTLDVGKGDITVDALIKAILPRFDAYRDSGGADRLPELVSACISALIYVCAVNAELRPLPAPAVKRQAKAKGASKPTKVIQVGYQTGAALKAYRRSEQAERGPSTSRTMRPHIRRAHFHTFKVGPGRTESIVKWLPPIPINVDGPAEKTTVVKIK